MQVTSQRGLLAYVGTPQVPVFMKVFVIPERGDSDALVSIEFDRAMNIDEQCGRPWADWHQAAYDEWMATIDLQCGFDPEDAQ